MRIIPLSLVACLLAGSALAQTAPTTASPPPSAAGVQVPPGPPATDQHNPVVATTTNANDSAQPAKGANSFTEAQAKGRLADRGYTDVAAMAKDSDGVWRGDAKQDGKPVHVWVDYKGNVGAQQ